MKSKLFRKALYVTGSIEDAQDIVQDVMITLWNKRTEWSEVKNMEVYAMVLTKNQALDKLKNKNRSHDSLDERNALFLPSENNCPLEHVIKNDEMKLMWKIIDQLSENQKKLVILREIQEQTYLEIAEIMQLSEAQVKINLYRARQKMRELYLKMHNYGL